MRSRRGRLGRVVAGLEAVGTVTRVRATAGYNLAYVALGVGLGLLAGDTTPTLSTQTTLVVAGYAVAAFLVKGSASVADAIHDRSVDADNPTGERVAAAVDRLGVERCWSLFVAELLLGTALAGWVAVTVDAMWPLAVAVATGLLGFAYSYPPRLKERGVVNHLVTTGVDVGAVVLASAVLVADRVTPEAVVVCGVVFAYTLGYHLVHQAADTHYDRASGVRTLATRLGVPRTLAVAAACSAAAAGFALALGYPLATAAAALTTGWYLRLYRATRTDPPKRRTDRVARRFDVAWVATGLNAVVAVAVWRHVFGPGVDLLAPLA